MLGLTEKSQVAEAGMQGLPVHSRGEGSATVAGMSLARWAFAVMRLRRFRSGGCNPAPGRFGLGGCNPAPTDASTTLAFAIPEAAAALPSSCAIAACVSFSTFSVTFGVSSPKSRRSPSEKLRRSRRMRLHHRISVRLSELVPPEPPSCKENSNGLNLSPARPSHKDELLGPTVLLKRDALKKHIFCTGPPRWSQRGTKWSRQVPRQCFHRHYTLK